MGECHYLEGNVNARRRVEYVAQLLEQIGLGRERIRMLNLSSAMAAPFADAVKEMTKEIRKIGPNPLRRGSSALPNTRHGGNDDCR